MIDLADVGLGRDHAAEVGALEPRTTRVCLRRPARNQDLAVVEQVHLAGELPRAVDGDHVLAAMRSSLEDLDRALEHQEEVDAALAALEQRGPIRHALLRPVTADALEHVVVQARERLVFAQVRVGGIGTRLGRARGRRSWRQSNPALPNPRPDVRPGGAVWCGWSDLNRHSIARNGF